MEGSYYPAGKQRSQLTQKMIPVFKVPSSVVPDTELLTTWKNDQVEADVSIAIGTLLPFWTSGTIQRKNMYKEAAMKIAMAA